MLGYTLLDAGSPFTGAIMYLPGLIVVPPDPGFVGLSQHQGIVQAVVETSTRDGEPPNADSRRVFTDLNIDGVSVDCSRIPVNREQFNETILQLRTNRGLRPGDPLPDVAELLTEATMLLSVAGDTATAFTGQTIASIPTRVQDDIPKPLAEIVNKVNMTTGREEGIVKNPKNLQETVVLPATDQTITQAPDSNTDKPAAISTRSLRDMIGEARNDKTLPITTAQPPLSQPSAEALVPRIEVEFEMENTPLDGSAFYHQVIREGTVLVLAFDKRAVGYPKNFPKRVVDDILVHVVGTNVVYVTKTTGIRFPFMSFELCVLLVSNEYPYKTQNDVVV